MLAIRTGDIIFGGDATVIKITSVASRDGKKIVDYPKSDASRRSVPIDAYPADIAKQWIEMKSQIMFELGFKPTMNMPLCFPGSTIWPYQN